MPAPTGSSGSSMTGDVEKNAQVEQTIMTAQMSSSEMSMVSDPPNWWWKYKQMLREPMAEFTGVMLLIIFGTGVDCQVVLSTNPDVASSHKGEFLSVNLGWALGK
ncbi:hypothetical protein H0H81_007379 [Sphagnurus paluster]|uniref:Uncharacterized protein n=1 Tax=Sphagnurus paluster TaxID=117069 RepID=A0A9P7KIM4_9AGAR|nr:hypothetical protein H0H81_007379 [Sphagnurus paluster]